MVQFGDGHREPHPPVADSDEELVEAVRFLGESVTPTRPFDDAHPTMTLALGDRFRLHAIGFGLSFRPSVTIRQHILTSVDLPELVDRGTMPDEVGRLLHAAILGRKSIVISGDQGAGKTTLLRALIASIPDNERFGTLETDYELLTHLQPNRRNMLALQARVGMGEVIGDHELSLRAACLDQQVTRDKRRQRRAAAAHDAQRQIKVGQGGTGRGEAGRVHEHAGIIEQHARIALPEHRRQPP